MSNRHFFKSKRQIMEEVTLMMLHFLIFKLGKLDGMSNIHRDDPIEQRQ